MDCKHASHLLSQSRERRLPWRQRLGLRLHLVFCRACAQFSRQLVLLQRAVRQVCVKIENDERLGLSKDARQRIQDAVADRSRQIDQARRNPDHNVID